MDTRPDGDRPHLVRYLALSYGGLALLGMAARWLPAMAPLALAMAIVALALLPMAGLWHRSAMRRLEALHRYAPQRWLGRWASKRILRQAANAAAAMLLAAAVLLQSLFFGAIEWTLLAAAPLVFLASRRVALARTASLFSRAAYAGSGASGFARIFTFATLCVAWVVAHWALAQDARKPLAEAVYELQAAWPVVGTATARWGIDAGAWGQATLATLDGTGSASWWRVAVALVFLPLTVFGFAAWSASGAMLDRAAWRRMLGARLVDADAPPPVGRSRLAKYGAGAAGAVLLAVLLLAWADAALQRHPRLLALSAIQSCERIGARMYSLGTLAKVAAYTTVLEKGMQGRRSEACTRIAEIGRIAGGNVDAYLDWYFSLGGDWTRFALTFAGDVESLMEVKFNKLVATDARIGTLLGELQLDQHYLVEVAAMGRNGIADVLEGQRLVLDERQCRVVADAGAALDALPRYDGLRARFAASAAAGVVAGAFAGGLTARAMQRASMQAAGRVLGRAAAKRGVSRMGSAAAGAALGAAAGSVAPGVGTAAGLVVGAAAGFATDIAMLAVEEKLTRADMRRDLLAAVDESLDALRAAFDCPARR